HDMHGNGWEWCEDADTTVNGEPGFVNRGGSWGSPADECNAAFRTIRMRTNVSQSHGLRLARVPAGAPSPEAKTPPPAVEGDTAGGRQSPGPTRVGPLTTKGIT